MDCVTRLISKMIILNGLRDNQPHLPIIAQPNCRTSEILRVKRCQRYLMHLHIIWVIRQDYSYAINWIVIAIANVCMFHRLLKYKDWRQPCSGPRTWVHRYFQYLCYYSVKNNAFVPKFWAQVATGNANTFIKFGCCNIYTSGFIQHHFQKSFNTK